MKFRCNACHVGQVSEAAMIAHYRKEHPEQGYSLWGAIGKLGDPFADGAMETLSEYRSARIKMLEEERVELAAKAKAYDELVPRWNRLAKAVQIVRLAIDE